MAEQDMQDMLSTLMFAANTDDAVNWRKLAENLREAPLPLTAKGHVSVLIDLANGRKVPGSRWNQFVGLNILTGIDGQSAKLPAKTLEFVEHNLSVIAEGSAKARANAAAMIASELSGKLLIAPTWTSARGRQDRIIARDMGAAIVYGFWLITDRTSELAGKLCRCRYSKCRKFFLKRPGKGGRGAPGRSYCSKTNHGVLGDREQAKQRMQLIRGEPRK